MKKVCTGFKARSLLTRGLFKLQGHLATCSLGCTGDGQSAGTLLLKWFDKSQRSSIHRQTRQEVKADNKPSLSDWMTGPEKPSLLGCEILFLRHKIEKRLRAVKTQEANGSHGKLVSWQHSLSRVNAKYTEENQVRGRILKDQTENVYFHFFQCTPKNGQKRPFHSHSHWSVNTNLRALSLFRESQSQRQKVR